MDNLTDYFLLLLEVIILIEQKDILCLFSSLSHRVFWHEVNHADTFYRTKIASILHCRRSDRPFKGEEGENPCRI